MTLLVGCDNSSPLPPSGDLVEFVATGLLPLEAHEGAYHLWLVQPENRLVDLGSFEGAEVVRATFGAAAGEAAIAEYAMVTLEPAGDTVGGPSQQKIIGGAIRDGGAELGPYRYLTAGIPLESDPGRHVLAAPVDLHGASTMGKGSGIWLYDPAGDTISGSFYLTFTPLSRGWIYEGWVVRDHGTEKAVWLSYGKFEPDPLRKANRRDDTGLGPFSGVLDYERALPLAIEVPGDDWVANPFDYPVPGAIALPLDMLLEPARWSHVITIEPRTDEDEEPWLAKPFRSLQPYRNAIGSAAPESPRQIHFQPDGLPVGAVSVSAEGGGV